MEPNSAYEDASIGSTVNIPNMSDGKVHTVKIAYTPGRIDVFMDDFTSPALTVAVDLATTLKLDKGAAWVGFTASTGLAWQNHDILNWTFNGTKVGDNCS